MRRRTGDARAAAIARKVSPWFRRLRAERVACNRHEDAARGGNVTSHIALGDCYFWGRGRPRRFLRALHHYERAAHVGAPRAHHAIGLIYQDGQHVARDLTRALRHFRSAARDGYADAMIETGVTLLARADGRDREACDWFEKASVGPHRAVQASALRFLADCYAKGRGRARNAATADTLHRRAARLGDLIARKIVLGDRFDTPSLRAVRQRGCRRLHEAARRRQVAAMRIVTHCVVRAR
ncbi:MAG: tetratricopeptide repeat protein [Pseudomonadota bacterium]